MSKLIFGCGYLGERVAQLWQAAGESVCRVTRSVERAARWQQEGHRACVADVTRPDTLRDLPSASTLLFAVGFDRRANRSIHEVYASGVKHVLAARGPSTERFIYISTTGVYGSAGGGWVDESTPPDPQRDGGKASLAAEQWLGRDGLVLRLGGIYGPGRIPYLRQLRAGEPIAAPSRGWLNLIHVDDAARIVLAAEAWAELRSTVTRPAAPELLCVTDGHPVERGDYYREVARQIDANPPQFVTPDPASPAAARASVSRRISNSKLQRELGYAYAYPTYREGLAAIL